jgi:hypothetical protein
MIPQTAAPPPGTGGVQRDSTNVVTTPTPAEKLTISSPLQSPSVQRGEHLGCLLIPRYTDFDLLQTARN